MYHTAAYLGQLQATSGNRENKELNNKHAFNCLPDDKIATLSKLKVFADNKLQLSLSKGNEYPTPKLLAQKLLSELELGNDFKTNRVPPWAKGKTCVKFPVPRSKSF